MLNKYLLIGGLSSLMLSVNFVTAGNAEKNWACVHSCNNTKYICLQAADRGSLEGECKREWQLCIKSCPTAK